MLEGRGIEYSCREYTEDPLSEQELREVLAKLGVSARDVLRKRDKIRREIGLSGKESDEVLIPHVAAHPRLLQRPIGVLDDCAALGRPVEKRLELVQS